MELFYQLKGFSVDEAKMMAGRLAEQPEQLLKTLAHEELGLSEKAFPNPWKSAVSAMLSTAGGAFVPVIPFLFLSGTQALVWSFCHQHRGAFCGRRVEGDRDGSVVVKEAARR